jgi:hypothetical protein
MRTGKVVHLTYTAQIFVDNPKNNRDAIKKARAIFRKKYNGKTWYLGAIVLNNKMENV